jgi:hypothetical protein
MCIGVPQSRIPASKFQVGETPITATNVTGWSLDYLSVPTLVVIGKRDRIGFNGKALLLTRCSASWYSPLPCELPKGAALSTRSGAAAEQASS